MIIRPFTLFILMIAIINSSYADKITIAADEWCPMNCQPGSDQEGFMIDIAKKVFAKKGHEIEYKIISWNRAVNLVRAGKINAAVGCYVEDCPDFVFPENELAMTDTSVFVKKENNWHYNGVTSLESVRLGIAADYSYGGELDLYIEKNKNNPAKIQVNTGDTPIENNIKMLFSDRVEAVLSSRSVFLYLSNKLNLENHFKLAGVTNKPQETYIAFSAALPTSEKYSKILSEGILELRQSGELEKILSRYGLTDWK
jgi:polar amino acid transport system substrate-binding protein